MSPLIIRIIPEIMARQPWDMLTHTLPTLKLVISKIGSMDTQDTITLHTTLIPMETFQTLSQTPIMDRCETTITKTAKQVVNSTTKILTKRPPAITAIIRMNHIETHQRVITIIMGQVRITSRQWLLHLLRNIIILHIMSQLSSSITDITPHLRPLFHPRHHNEILIR